MFDPALWTALAKAEWTAIATAPFNFVGAVVVGWLIGWLIIKAWYRREIGAEKKQRELEKSKTELVQKELDLERRQKKGLRQVIKDLQPDAKVLALEVAYGDPEVRRAVMSLARGDTISTPINPTAPFMATSIPSGELNKTAVALYTSANGLSQTTSVQPGGVTVSSSTSVGVQVADYLNRGPVSGTKKSG
jgi:hypothetical protein